MEAGDNATTTVVAALPGGQSPGSGMPPAHYLLVFEFESSSIFRLPASGELTIGRSESAHLRLRGQLVSRSHARLTLQDGEVRIRDLGSQNGTFVNGERIEGERLLVSGDSIAISSTTLVFHGQGRQRGVRAILALDVLRERLHEEVDRAVRYQRPLSVVCLVLPAGFQDRAKLPSLVGKQVRLIDLMGWGGHDQLFVVMPETTGHDARGVAARLLEELDRSAPGIRGGFASYPVDGCDGDTLLSGARAAAQTAVPGEINGLAQSARTIQVGDDSVVVADAAMIGLYGLIERLAKADLPVIIGGETGTGKELAASALHHWSPRAQHPLRTLNCAAIQETLAESELFGHERGAFSGAATAKPGLLEAADGGTLFLDEVGELPLPVQAKLLRVLETRRFSRVGEVRERTVDVRIVSATNRDLEQEVKAGRFRRDLFYRLGAAKLWLPPLRDRKLEIPLLAQRFLHTACARAKRPEMSLSPDALERLVQHAWPGNVRELRNLMDYLAASTAERVIEPRHLEALLGRGEMGPLPPPVAEDLPAAGPGPFRPIEEEIDELVQRRIQQALEAAGGNKTRAAALIGMPLRTFLTKLKRYQVAVGS